MRRIGRVLLPVLFWLGVWQLAAAAVGQVDVLASVDDHPVAVRYENQIGLSFHPELSPDTRIHETFLQLCEA